MLIDWFTVFAQALNFLVLVLLLKRFLYKPILLAIEAREKRIAEQLADAHAKKTEAQAERDEFLLKNEEFDAQRAALLSQATDEANIEHQRLLDEAHKTIEDMLTKRQETLRADALILNQAIRLRAQQEVFAITRKALVDLASTSLEERVADVFSRRIREMDGKAKERLAGLMKTSSEPALVRSAFDLPEPQRATIQNALNDTFSTEVKVRFETKPDLISGIEFIVNGLKVAWSISDYLESMKKGLDDLLDASTPPQPEAKSNEHGA